MIDDVSAVSGDLCALQRDLSFAAYIVERTHSTSPLYARYYQPYTLPHSTPEHMQQEYDIHQTGARTYLIIHSMLHDKELLHRLHDLHDTLLGAAKQKSPLWLACKNTLDHSTPRPPCHAARTVRCCLDAHVLWYSMSCLLDTCHISIRPVFSEFNDASATMSFWSDIAEAIEYTAHCARLHWVWCRSEEAHAVLCMHPDVMPVLQAEFHGVVWQLCTTETTVAELTHTTRERHVCFFKSHKRTMVAPLFTAHLPPVHVECTRLTTHFIRQHLRNTDLAGWATCMQERLRYVHCRGHKTLCIARGVSRVHEWQICVPPPFEYISAVQCHMLCAYIGRTTHALIKRLRKHISTTLAHTEDSRFHEMLRSTDLADWMIVPVELVWSEWEAAVAERYWWDKFRRWCLNDMPPRIPTSSAKPSKLMPRRALQIIRSLSAARLANDFPRVAALKKEIALIGAELQLPLLISAIIRVPYMTGQYKLAVAPVINALLRRVPCTSWERQAMRGRIQLVRTVPHTVRRCFESQSNLCETEWERPRCFCTAEFLPSWEQGGTVTIRDGHFCLLPISVNFHGAELRSKDALPLPGLSCRDTAIEDLNDLARLLNVPMPNTDKLLPKAIFNHSGAMLSYVQAVSTRLSEVAIVRIVDKSLETMWGFCRQWIWDETTQFLRTERYTDTNRPPAEVLSGLCDLVRGKGWACHDRARLALLYLIGKGKSLALPRITWRPICAQSAPVIPRWRLRIAALAFTCFLKTLAREIPGSFLHLSIQGVAHWMTDLNAWNCTVLGEADCKDQFNRILPSDVLNHFQQATKWLRSQRRWRATQMFWSLHKYDKRLDRCGKASACNFDMLSHSELTDLITFYLQDDNFCQSAGTCWSQAFALPMGGPLSARAANLRSQWCFHLQKQRFHVFDELRSTDAGYPIWVSSTGRVIALAQFRDNIYFFSCS